MKVRITRQARADLEAIARWIADDNPVRAISFIDELQERCRSLAAHPRRFPVFCMISGEDVRKLNHKGYMIFYFVLNDTVEVLHVVHEARDLPSLFPEPD